MQAIYYPQPPNHYLQRLITNLGRLPFTISDKTVPFFFKNSLFKAYGFGEYFSRLFSFQANNFINGGLIFNENDFYFNPKATDKLSLNKIGSGLNGGGKYLTLMQQINK